MRRTAALFLLALAGVAVIIGLALSTLGWPILLAYLAAVATAAGLMVRRARAIVRSRLPAATGRTCTCCTSSVHDPVEIR